MVTAKDDAVRVSVVLATRDGERWVAEQLTSVLEQSRPVDEVVVVDDASVDRTVELVEQVAAFHDVPVEVVRRPQALGLLGNLEDGLRRARGDVLLLSDQDDVWEPDKVRRLLAALAERPGAAGAFSDATEVDGSGAPTGRRLWGPAGLDDAALSTWAHDPLALLLRGNCVTGATMALRREALELVLPFPPFGFHDAWTALLLAAAHGPDGLVAVPEPLVRYRVHGSNLSGGLLPTGRVAGHLWTVDRVRRTEQHEREQLPRAVERLDHHGVDSSRLQGKLDFFERRRRLPRSAVRRVRAVARMRADYVRYGSGNLSALLDAVWFDPVQGRPRPLPARVAARVTP